MTFRTVPYLNCDGSKYLKPATGCQATINGEVGELAFEVRKFAKSVFWTNRRTEDFCPICSKRLSDTPHDDQEPSK